MDKKPNKLFLRDARPRGRSISGSENFDGPFHPYGHNGGYPFPYQMPSTFFLPPTMPQAQHSHLQPPPFAPAPSGPMVTAVAPVQAPAIKPWLEFIEHHALRNPDNIPFTLYGNQLLNQGIRRISQLQQEYITRQDLQTWLGVDVGTAILLFQYAKEDMDNASRGIDVLL